MRAALAADGKLMAQHALDVPFVFDTLDRTGITGHSPAAPAIAAVESATWAAFARSGTPDNRAIPHWPAYTPADRATMMIDTEWRELLVGNLILCEIDAELAVKAAANYRFLRS